MLIIGLVLILGSGAAATAVVMTGDGSATMDVFGATVTTTVAGVFVAGAAAMLLFLLGCWLMRGALRRGRRARSKNKELKATHEESVTRLEEERSTLEEENARMAQELDEERRARSPNDVNQP